jgi:carbonic anhydrase/acetyltransferase-like protein (isoleucine patch superfamily)
MIISLDGITPTIDPSAYVQESARVIGDVHIGADSSIWFQTVLRGDVHSIRIGARTNIQDNSTVHVTSGRHGTTVGDDVTVGHGVVLHGCTVGNGSLIGIGAIVLDRCDIGEQCMVGAGALLAPGTVVPPHSLVLGQPGKVVRPLREEELASLAASAANYVLNASRYKRQGI